MQSLKNVYRICVMVVTLAIVAMGWRLYGPPASQVKTMALRGIERIESWLRPEGDPSAALPATAKPPAKQELAPMAVTAPPPLFEKGQAADRNSRVAGDGEVTATLAKTSPALFPSKERELPVSPAVDSKSSAADSLASSASTPPSARNASESQLKSLLARLESLDVQDSQLTPWGGSGQLYRCCCQANWGQSPQFSRHFESVAAEPEAAVDQVVAQIAAWRTAERQTR